MGRRPDLSAAQKRELWQRWKAGQSLNEIGRALEHQAASIHSVVSATAASFLGRAADALRR